MATLDDSQSVATTTPYGYAVAAVSMVTFKLVHFAIGRLIGPPSACKTELERWKWMNIAVSWVHSTIVGIACSYGFWRYPAVMDDLVEFNNPYLYTIVALSTGYFIYDFIDVVYYGHTRAMWEVLLHHVAVLNSFLYNVTECRFIGYTIVALFVEVNSIFLHARKLIQMDGRIGFQHPVYRTVAVVNFATFVVCRFVFSLSVITYGLVAYPSMMSTYYYWSLTMTMVLTWIVNVMLFWRLLKSDVMRGLRARGDARRKGAAASSSGNAAVANGHPADVVVGNNNNNGRKVVDNGVKRHNVVDLGDGGRSVEKDNYRPKRS